MIEKPKNKPTLQELLSQKNKPNDFYTEPSIESLRNKRRNHIVFYFLVSGEET